MNKILLHIPHASTKLPNEFWENVVQAKEVINRFMNVITDVDTDKLFAENEYDKLVFPYSRVFCDVEKFADDELETMSKYGMGVVYSKTNLGVCFRSYDKEYTDKVLTKYYYPYHQELNEKAENMLSDGSLVVLIDCHSFSKEIIMEKDKQVDLPEICIGYNDEDTLANLCVRYFEEKKYK